MRPLSLLLRIVMALACATLLTACQTLGPTGLVPSTVSTDLTPETASIIASDMVGRFAEQVGPGNTTIHIAPDTSLFGQALEASLRSWGYAVLTDQKTDNTGAIALAYVVDDFEGSVLVRLSTQSLDLTRMYKVTAGGATPTSPLSIQQHAAAGTP